MKVFEILKAIEAFAPLSLALGWDNVGLLVGDPQAEVSKVLISLDLTPGTVDKAISDGAELILTHHPIWLHGTKQLTDPVILRMIKAGIAHIALHTNLDVAANGVNHELARALGLKVIRHLSGESGNARYRLVVTTPEHARDQVREAAFSAGAGRIGNYDHCMTSFTVHGGFRPGEGSNPALGRRGVWHQADEIRMEFTIDKNRLKACVDAIIAVHPFEAPDIYWNEISDHGSVYGLGLVCEPTTPMTLEMLSLHTKQSLGIPTLRYWTAGLAGDTPVSRIALCGGAGSSMIKDAERSADVLITGDISYHYLLDSRIPIIDAGHFYTEYPALQLLAGKIRDLGLIGEILPQTEHEFALNNKYI